MTGTARQAPPARIIRLGADYELEYRTVPYGSRERNAARTFRIKYGLLVWSLSRHESRTSKPRIRSSLTASRAAPYSLEARDGKRCSQMLLLQQMLIHAALFRRPWTHVHSAYKVIR